MARRRRAAAHRRRRRHLAHPAEHNGAELIHEIELLWLAAIAAAKRFVYIESQYFANRRVAEAMAERLREDDGPEFVVVNPETAQGWLSEKAMGVARAKLLHMRAAGRRARPVRLTCR